MDYVIRGDTESLKRLASIFTTVCEAQGVKVGMIKSTIIMINLLDEAKKAGVFAPITPPGGKNEKT